MYTIDDLKPLRVYNKRLHLPLSENSRREGSAIFLLTPNINSSIDMINNRIFINQNYFNSYYIEKDTSYYINHEGYLEDVTDSNFRNVLNENNIIKSNDLILEETSKITVCSKCGSKNIGVYLMGEPIYKCNDCGKELGVVPFEPEKKKTVNEGRFINYRKKEDEKQIKELMSIIYN